MPLTAGTPLDVLTTRLARADWGDLGTPPLRGLARVLMALADALDPRSGAGKVTAQQLAGKTCYTERWVRRCLGLLEELDLIEWQRGGIVQGKPTPSWVRVSKSVLVDLIHVARAQQAEQRAERATATRVRVAALRTSYTRPRDRKRRQSRTPRPHAEVATALRFNKEVPAAESAAEDGQKDRKAEAPASTDTARSMAARIRADLAARRGRGRKSAAMEVGAERPSLDLQRHM